MDILQVIELVVGIGFIPVIIMLWRIMGKLEGLNGLSEISDLLKAHAIEEKITKDKNHEIQMRVLDRLDNKTTNCIRYGHKLSEDMQ